MQRETCQQKNIRGKFKRGKFFSSFTFPVSSSFGFTLAEVLITLGIIGIVAALTIPTLIKKTTEKQTITALKEAYSILSQAYTSAVQDKGTPDTWGLVGGSVDPKIINNLLPYLKVSKNCIGQTNCFPSINILESNEREGVYYGNYYNTRPTVQLSDGFLLSAVYVHSATCKEYNGATPALSSSCAIMSVDINAFKKPNQMGTDVFCFYLTKAGIVPLGSAAETGSLAFDSYCKDKMVATTENGVSCAAWVLYNENMDYLKCNDLSWATKTKCD